MTCHTWTDQLNQQNSLDSHIHPYTIPLAKPTKAGFHEITCQCSLQTLHSPFQTLYLKDSFGATFPYREVTIIVTTSIKVLFAIYNKRVGKAQI